jgi:hypothetical protein
VKITETNFNPRSDIQENGLTEVILVINHRETVRNEIRSVPNQATVMKTGITEADCTIKMIHCKTKCPPQ